MMNRLRKFLIILLMAGSLGGVQLATAQEPYFVGEKIVYAIKKMKVKAGDATLIFHGKKMLEGKEVYAMTFRADGFNFLDEEKIFLDLVTFRPVRVERNLNIFGKEEKIVEDYEAEKGRVKIVKDAGGKTEEQVIAKDKPLDNLYGFIYRYRLQGKFQIGEEVVLNLPTQEVRIKLIDQDHQVKAAGKQYRTFYMASDPAKYRIWFDTSDRRIPLRIDGAVGFAKTAMIMKEYEHED
ncbi:MAG: DUF3108 domain-containing protein [Candidatus Omnitrophica bacterium]|nr:DUF3108 domain-containing protein [Candidatus Omnitrophota bacterium]